MKKKIIIIAIGLIIIIVGIIAINKIQKHKKEQYELSDEYMRLRDADFYSHYSMPGDEREMLVVLLNDEKENWTYMKITDKFRNKYKKKKILDDKDIIKFYWTQDDMKMLQGLPIDFVWILCEKNDGIYAYTFDVKIVGEYIDEVKVKDIVKLYDNNSGYTDEYYIKFTKENYVSLFEKILFPSYVNDMMKSIDTPNIIDRTNVALTKNFIDKYGYDKDIIDYKTPIPYNGFLINEIESSFENGKLSFNINFEYEEKNLHCNYDFIIKNGYLDDIIIIEQNIANENREKIKNEYQIFDRISIKGSDWSLCPLSEKFLSKYNNKDSIFPEYDIVGNEVILLDGSKFVEVKNKMFRKLYNNDGGEILCLYKWILNSNNEVDDILTYIIPEDKMNLTYEEMYSLAFNE